MTMRYHLLYSLLFGVSWLQVQAQPTGNVNYKLGNVNYDDGAQRVTQNVWPQATINNPNVLELEVRVLSNQRADQYTAIFNLTQAGKTTEETNGLLQERATAFKVALKGLGLPDTAIFFDLISFVPLYEYEVEKKLFSRNNVEVPKGYEIQQNVHVAFTDGAQFTNIMTAASKLGIFDLVKVDYTVDDQEAIYTQMRTQAVQNLTEKLSLYETQLKLDLKEAPRTLSEARSVVFPLDRYSSYQAFANISTEEATEKGKTRQMYKPRTQFYDKVEASDADVVINPHVVEPVVQYFYHLKLYIQLPGPKREQPKNAYFWLTPEGEVVPVAPNKQ